MDSYSLSEAQHPRLHLFFDPHACLQQWPSASPFPLARLYYLRSSLSASSPLIFPRPRDPSVSAIEPATAHWCAFFQPLLHFGQQSTSLACDTARINGDRNVRIVTPLEGGGECPLPNRQADGGPNPCDSAPHRNRRCCHDRGTMLSRRVRDQWHAEQSAPRRRKRDPHLQHRLGRGFPLGEVLCKPPWSKSRCSAHPLGCKHS